MAAKICEECGRMFDARRSTARFCSPKCRKRANKRKEPILPKVEPAPMPAATFDDVAVALDAARGVSNTFAQLSATAPRPLRPGCRRIGEAITRAIDDEEW